MLLYVLKDFYKYLCELYTIAKMSDNYSVTLIELVESKPILYDKDNSGFRDHVEKHKAWNAVVADLRGMGFECNISEVQNEWQRIRERFSRERKKNGQPDNRKPWELMSHLEFLKKVVKYRRNRQIRRRTLPVDAILSVSASYDNFPNVNSDSKLEIRNEENSFVDVSSADYDCIDNTLASYACTNRSSTECEVSASTPTPAVKRPKLYVPATSRQVTPQTNSALFSVKQREGDTLKETLNTYLSVATEMSQNINTFLHNRSERSPSTHDPDEESLRGFIMGFLPFWKAIGLKERATLMSSVTALFADALQKSEAPK